MRSPSFSRLAVSLLAPFVITAAVLAQDTSARVKSDVVSIKPNTQPITAPTSAPVLRPDGGLTMYRIPIR